MKPNVIPSVFLFIFIKNKSSQNQPKRRSPRKRHLNTEFVKPKLNKFSPEIIDADSPPPNNSFKSNQQSSSIVFKNCERLSFENMLLKEKVKVLEEEKNKLEEELKCSKFYAGSLKSRVFTYDNFVTDGKLFRATAKDKEEDRSDVLSSPSFSPPASKPRRQPKLAGFDQLFLFLSWLRLSSPLKDTAWVFNLSKSTASRCITT